MVSIKKRQMLVNIVRLITNVIYNCDFSSSVLVTAIRHLDFSGTNFVNQFNDKVTEEFVYIIVILHATEYVCHMLMILQQYYCNF